MAKVTGQGECTVISRDKVSEESCTYAFIARRQHLARVSRSVRRYFKTRRPSRPFWGPRVPRRHTCVTSKRNSGWRISPKVLACRGVLANLSAPVT